MSRQFLCRTAVLAVPLAIGIAVGFLGSEAARSGPSLAVAADNPGAVAAPGLEIAQAPQAAEQPQGDQSKKDKTKAAKGKSSRSGRVQRFGSVIGLKPEKAEEYIKLHAETWPEVLAMIRECNIRNYSIFLGTLDDGNLYLFSYFEYTGKDFEADMKRMAADPNTQRWWKVTDPCQVPQKNRKKGEHWMTMREVFHTD